MTWTGPRVPISRWLTDVGVDHDFMDIPGYRSDVPYGFEPVGVVVHYPVGIDDVGEDSMLNLVCCVGTSNAPAPIYQVYVDHLDGGITVVSEGRCNHAGGGVESRLDAARADQPPPADSPPDDFPNGNRWWIGITLEGPPTTDYQRIEAARVCAAICVGAGWSHNRVIGHEEWSPADKVDPDFDMVWFRELVREEMETMTPEADAFYQELFDKLQDLGWTTGDNAAKRIDYANDLRNELAGRTGNGGHQAALIAAALALVAELDHDHPLPDHDHPPADHSHDFELPDHRHKATPSGWVE